MNETAEPQQLMPGRRGGRPDSIRVCDHHHRRRLHSGEGRTSYSFYDCPPQLEEKAENVFQRFDGLVRGEPWFNGDHMIFLQSRIPSMAFTSELMPELMRTVTHTSSDTPDIIDCHKLVEVAKSLNALVRSFQSQADAHPHLTAAGSPLACALGRQRRRSRAAHAPGRSCSR